MERKKNLAARNRRTLGNSSFNRPGLRILHVLLVLAGVTMILYGQTIGFSYTWFDDDAILIRNQEYISGFSNLADAITRDAEFQKKSMELYRPLQNVSFMLDTRIGGFNAGMFHFSSMCIHFLTTVMLFLLLEAIGFSRRLAFAGALLLALHPVFSFTVAWLPARGDLLLAFWSLTAVYCFVHFLKEGKNQYLFFHLLSFTLAMMSKESGVMIIAVCLFYGLLLHDRLRWRLWQLYLGLGYLAIIACIFWLRSFAVTDVKEGAFSAVAFFYNLPVIPEVVKTFILPFPMISLPFYNTLRTLTGTVLIIVMLWLMVRKWPEWKAFLFGILWFAGFTAPSMMYRPDWSDYIYDYVIHRSYLPLVGLIITTLFLLKHAESRLFSKPWIYVTSGLAFVFMVLSFSFTRTFKEPVNFWRYAVKTNSASAFAHTYYGGALFFEGRPEQAIESYNRAIALKSDFKEAILNRGITLASTGKHAMAVKDFSHYLREMPDDTMVLKYRADSYIELADYHHAVVDLKKLVNKGDQSEKVLFHYGLSSLLTGNYAEAHEVLQKLCSLFPEKPQVLHVSALTDLMNGDPEQSVLKYQRILSMNNPDQNLLTNLGYAYWENREYRQAIESFEKALKMGGETLSLNLGLLLGYHAEGNVTETIRMKQRIYTLHPAMKQPSAAIDSLKKQGYLFTSRQAGTLINLLGS